MILILLAVLGLAADPAQPTPVRSAPVHPHVAGDHDHGAPSADPAQAVMDQLTGKAAVTCDQIFAMGSPSEVRGALVAGTAVSMPPWAPMRAAGCLTQLAATDDVALGHVGKLAALEAQPGFALVISEHLSELPADRAVQLANQALANPSPALDRRLPTRLQSCGHPSVQALVP